eukprot:403375961
MPSAFSKGKGFLQQDQSVKSIIEFDFRQTVNKLASGFSLQLCQNSPYLESIMKDLDNLNQIFEKSSAINSARSKEFNSKRQSRVEGGNFSVSPHKHSLPYDNSQSPSIKLRNPSGQISSSKKALSLGMSQFNNDRMDKKTKENEQLKEKVKALDELTQNMRKNYYKDLMTYKNTGAQNWKSQSNKKNNLLSDEDQINVEFFNILEGVDAEILEVVNQRLFKVKEKCEKRIVQHIRFQEELLKKLHAMNKLSPNAYSIVNLSITEIFTALKVVHQNPEVIWEEIHVHYGQDCLLTIIEREYGSKFAKDYSALNQEIDKIKDEAQFQIKEVLKQSQNEIVQLRKSLDLKNQEIVSLKESQLKEIEKAQKEAYFIADLSFQSKEARIFQKYDSEKQELYHKIEHLETVNTNFDQILTKETLKSSFIKLALLAQLNKILIQINNTNVKDLEDSNESNLKPYLNEEIIKSSINRIFDIILGRTQQEIYTLKKEYENDVKNLMEENNQQNVQMAEMKMIVEQQTEKIQYIEQQLCDSQQEAQMYKSQVESMKEEHRKLEGEHLTLKRALENSENFCEGLEKERKRIEFELQKIAGNNINKYQSAYAEAELHRKKALNSITKTGEASLNHIYAQNNKTKGTQTNLKDVNAEIEFIKRSANGVETRIQNILKAPSKSIFCQTEPGLVIMTEAEFKLSRNRGSTKKTVKQLSEVIINQFNPEKQIEEIKELSDSFDSLYQSDLKSDKEYSKDPRKNNNIIIEIGIQCDLIGDKSIAKISTNQGFNRSMQDWKSRLSSSSILAEKFEANIKMKEMLENQKSQLYESMTNIERDMPEVYKRLWLNVLEKSAKSQRIRDEFDKIRQEQWNKVQDQLAGYQPAKAKNIFSKDSITGKVFINLVELYKNTQFLIPSTFKSTVNGQNQRNLNLSTRMMPQMITDYIQEEPELDSLNKNLIDNGTQTDLPFDQTFLRKRMLLQSQALSRNLAFDHPNTSNQSMHNQSTDNLDSNSITLNNSGINQSKIRTQKQSKSQMNNYSMKEGSMNEYYNKSKILFMKHQQNKQKMQLYNSMINRVKKIQITSQYENFNQNVSGISESLSQPISKKYHASSTVSTTKHLMNDSQPSVFEIPNCIKPQITGNQSSYQSPKANIYSSQATIMSKTSSSANKHVINALQNSSNQRNKDTFINSKQNINIYLNQPEVKIHRNRTNTNTKTHINNL